MKSSDVSHLVVIAEVCLGELKSNERSSGAGKSKFDRNVAGTLDDVCDSPSGETVDNECRTTTNQQQLSAVRKFQVFDDVVSRQRGVLDVQYCLGLDLS